MVRQLRDISIQFGEPFRAARIKLLNTHLDLKDWKVEEILAWHDTLLLLLAWPEDKETGELVKRSLFVLTTALKEKMLINNVLEQKLSGTGLPGTTHTGRFSFAITNWLVNQFGNKVELHSSEASPETVRLFFRSLLPGAEYEAISSGALNLLQRIKKIKGKNNLPAIKWLADLITAAPLPYPNKEFLFNELKLFVSWKLDHPDFNRSCLCLPVKKIYYHQELTRVPDIRKIIKTKLPLPAHISGEEQQKLANAAKASLVFLFRETDPFSLAAPDSVTFFRLENGFSIGLYSMGEERQLSIESYIGYLVFKNGIPVAYGGGWIFGERCQFGINILAPFRGAASAYILSLLIRVYHQYFGVKRFVVKPYQFGKNNKEALTAGAFWFYYKLGFRPEDQQIQQLAADEWEKKKTTNHYRSSMGLLKKFTTSNIVLLLAENPVPAFDASALSQAITHYINNNFYSNREQALRDCERRTKKELHIRSTHSWNKYERNALKQWGLLVQANLNIAKWSRHEKKQLTEIIKAKGSNDEQSFICLLQQHRRLWKDLSETF